MELIKNLREASIIKSLFLALLGTIILALSAKVKIPFWPVPMTMQTFVVLMLGIVYGWKLGLFTVTLYLFEGIFGLPVFAGTPEKGLGIIYFTGPTMGYLLGFLITVSLTGLINFNNSFFKNILKLVFSVSFIYILGVIWLGYVIGWDKPLFKLGVQPFLLAELFKISILAFLIPKIKNFSL
tara:strand:- start:17706 stop:18251 length:546 start_codon:yes stop_codon:yes gene_type:complete